MKTEKALYDLYEDAYSNNKFSDYGKERVNKNYDKVLYDLDILELLKSKTVDLRFIYTKLYMSIKELTKVYNETNHNLEILNINLTEQEMRKIVNWLKRKN